MNSFNTIPISLTFAPDDIALVVGGGQVAYQKIRWLQSFGVTIEVIAPSVIPEIRELAIHPAFTVRLQEYTGLHRPYLLVICATDNETVNQQVHHDAVAQKIPVNVVDAPALCTFFVPSVISRGRLHMAVSSNGDAPALCRRIRKEVSSLIPDHYAQTTERLAHARKKIKSAVSSPGRRAEIMTHLASWQFIERLAELPPPERRDAFERELSHQIAQAEQHTPRAGKVYLVGAGPGDPNLITVKGFRVLAAADAVLYDGLVNPVLLQSLESRVQRFDTSKRAGCALNNQNDINHLMVRLAQEGNTVVRLKGGDPCVFGRISDEVRALSKANIPFEIVPGVSSAIAAPAYAGIPITDRDCASYFQVITGHETPEKTESRVNWKEIAQSRGTLVFLMGVHRVTHIARKLIEHGKAPQTPLALISHGTLPTQTVFESTLKSILRNDTILPEMPRPALIVVGEVVQLRSEFKWFR